MLKNETLIHTRRCPGELYDISESICKGRQRVHYPKCPVCRYSKETTIPSEAEEQVDDAGNVKNINKRNVAQLSTNLDKSINQKIFKNYDILGIYPDELNEYTSEKIGMATTIFLKSIKGDIKNIVVGRDVRPSSKSLANSFKKGIIKAGVNAIDIGEVSTDTTCFAVGYYNYDAGITVTASHHPSNYNGFKICHEKAMPISFDTGLSKILEIARQTRLPTSARSGKVITKNVFDDYNRFVRNFAHNIRPLKVVVDAGNGMAGKIVSKIFEDLPCEIIPLYFKPDGTFPNHGPEPLQKENLVDLQEKVRTAKAHLGVAFDGDADRCVFVDENGQPVACDLITAIISTELLKKNKGSTVVYDLRSSWTVSEEVKNAGGRPYREKVGHSHIKAAMREKNAIFGGELTGRYYFKNNFYSDSGVIALIEILNILSRKNVPMSNLVSPLKRYFSTGEIEFEVEDKDNKIKQIAQHFKDGKIDYLDGITVEYEDWWFNLRKSNTGPMLKLNLEAKTKKIRLQQKKLVVDVIRKD